MKKTFTICLWATLLLAAFLLAMNGMRRRDEALVSQLAPEVLRFHVLANSNSEEDQALKLAVKDFLLEQLRPHAASKKGAQDYIIQNRDDLEEMAENFMRGLGFDYPAEIRIETCEFPERVYGDVRFPAGMYDAVRVLIGDGAGENFWCVLYPSLCYLDSTYAVMPEESKGALSAVLPEDDFAALLAARRVKQAKTDRHSAPNSAGHPLEAGSAQTDTAVEDKNTEQNPLLPRVTFRFQFAELFSAF